MELVFFREMHDVVSVVKFLREATRWVDQIEEPMSKHMDHNDEECSIGNKSTWASCY